MAREISHLRESSTKSTVEDTNPAQSVTNPVNSEIPELLNQKEVAKIYGVSLAWMERARWAGTGPKFIKIGRLVRYYLSDVLDFINASPRRTIAGKGE